MDHKLLGKTGIRLPEVGLGTWQYVGGIEPLRRGVDLGACLIDTAESYGTEEIVGAAIKDMRDRVFIAAKVSRKHFRRSDLLQAADISLQRLNINQIDLYQLHNWSDEVPIEETMSAMEELVDMGKVRFIGVSNFSVPDLKQAQTALSKHRIVSNQVSYNLVNRSIEANILPFCQEHDITVIAYSPLAHDIDQIKMRDPAGTLGRLSAAIGKTEAQIALNWCLSRNRVIVIPKSNSIKHTVENCHASGWRLSPDQVRLLEETIQHPGRFKLAIKRTACHVARRLDWHRFCCC